MAKQLHRALIEYGNPIRTNEFFVHDNGDLERIQEPAMYTPGQRIEILNFVEVLAEFMLRYHGKNILVEKLPAPPPPSGDTVTLSWGVRATTNIPGDIRVEFEEPSQTTVVENTSPYSLFGDTDFGSRGASTHAIKAKVYDQAGSVVRAQQRITVIEHFPTVSPELDRFLKALIEYDDPLATSEFYIHEDTELERIQEPAIYNPTQRRALISFIETLTKFMLAFDGKKIHIFRLP